MSFPARLAMDNLPVKVSAHAYRLGSCLADHVSRDGLVWISLETMAKETGDQTKTMRTTTRALAELVGTKLFLIVQPGGGRGKTTRYKMNVSFDKIEKSDGGQRDIAVWNDDAGTQMPADDPTMARRRQRTDAIRMRAMAKLDAENSAKRNSATDGRVLADGNSAICGTVSEKLCQTVHGNSAKPCTETLPPVAEEPVKRDSVKREPVQDFVALRAPAIDGGVTFKSGDDDDWGVDAYLRTLDPKPCLYFDGGPYDDPEIVYWFGHDIRDTCKALAESARLPTSWRGDWSVLGTWIKQGYCLGQIQAVIEEWAAKPHSKLPTSLSYFFQMVEDQTSGGNMGYGPPRHTTAIEYLEKKERCARQELKDAIAAELYLKEFGETQEGEANEAAEVTAGAREWLAKLLDVRRNLLDEAPGMTDLTEAQFAEMRDDERIADHRKQEIA